jgi:hypothetical protein
MSNGMRDRAKKTAKKVDERLAEIESNLLANTTLNWEAIRPKLANQAEYDRLMTIVQECTSRNESVGELVARLKALGAGGEALLEKVKRLLVA